MTTPDPSSNVSLRSPLGSKSSSEGDLADVLAVGLSGQLGGSFDQSQLVVGEPDGDDVGTRVVGFGPAGSRGHDTTIAYTETLDQADLSVYDKCMTTKTCAAPNCTKTIATPVWASPEQDGLVRKGWAFGVDGRVTCPDHDLMKVIERKASL